MVFFLPSLYIYIYIYIYKISRKQLNPIRAEVLVNIYLDKSINLLIYVEMIDCRKSDSMIEICGK